MKNIIKMTLVLTLVFSLSIPSAWGFFERSEENEALIGTWDVELIEMGMQMQFIFKMEEDALTGALEFEMGSGILEEIVFEENKLTFMVTIDAGGQNMTIETEATIDGEEMAGTMYTEMGDAAFEGTKRK